MIPQLTTAILIPPHHICVITRRAQQKRERNAKDQPKAAASQLKANRESDSESESLPAMQPFSYPSTPVLPC